MTAWRMGGETLNAEAEASRPTIRSGVCIMNDGIRRRELRLRGHERDRDGDVNQDQQEIQPADTVPRTVPLVASRLICGQCKALRV